MTPTVPILDASGVTGLEAPGSVDARTAAEASGDDSTGAS
jgi:hypothetical protein